MSVLTATLLFLEIPESPPTAAQTSDSENTPQQTERCLTSWMNLKDEWSNILELGDIIEFYRKGCFFNHWGIYLGNGLLAHVTCFSAPTTLASLFRASASQWPPSDDAQHNHDPHGNHEPPVDPEVRCGETVITLSPRNCGRRMAEKGKYFVRIDRMEDVANGDSFRVNNLTYWKKTNQKERQWKELVEKVAGTAHQEFEYSLLYNNCVHFVMGLRYVTRGS